MGLIREPEGVDFIISGGPLTPEGAAEVSEWIRQDREAKAKERLRKVECRVLALPHGERAELVCTILKSLANEGLDDLTQAEIAKAIRGFSESQTDDCPSPSHRPRRNTRATVSKRAMRRDTASVKRTRSPAKT